jgi:two-component system response regulator AtoC
MSELSALRVPLNVNGDHAVWGNSEGMRRIAAVIEQVGDSDVAVLIRGETGVGKELVSRAIHWQSTRRRQPFVKVNCAALPADLLESELFGHEKGAFTGAATTRIGKFEQAGGGTLMLDEIGELAPALQAKLLHVLQDGEFTKLGSNKRVQMDARVVAATNRNLEEMIFAGGFRADLYYRLRVIELTVPALRERREEIPTLVDSFMAQYASQYKRPALPLSPQLRQRLMEYDWPGNIRELENVVRRLVLLQDEQIACVEIDRSLRRAASAPSPAMADAVEAVGVALGGLPRTFPRVLPLSGLTRPLPAVGESVGSESPEPAGAGDVSLALVGRAAAMKAQRALIEKTLTQVNWNRRKASQLLGVSYKTLLNKIKECSLDRD